MEIFRFSQPTEIQKLVLPEAIGEGNDILGAAETVKLKQKEKSN